MRPLPIKLKKRWLVAALLLISFSFSGCGNHLPRFTSCIIIASDSELYCDNEKSIAFPPNPFFLCVSPRDSELVDNFFVSLIKAKEKKSCAPRYPDVSVCATVDGGLICEEGFLTLKQANKFICVSQRDDQILTNWVIDTKKDLSDC